MNVLKCRLVWMVLMLAVSWHQAGAQTNPESRELLGLVTNNFAVSRAYRVTTTLIHTQQIRLPPKFQTNSLLATNPIVIRLRTNEWSYTNQVFESYLPGSLPQLVWTNFCARTNGLTMNIWAERSHPLAWPLEPPSVKWNNSSLIWGMRGMTALSPSWAGQGAVGQVPLTALTRRHVYSRGHGMGPDGVSPGFKGKRAWFLTTNNTLVTRSIENAIVRTAPGTNKVHRDYTILLLDRDLPDSIEPMAVASNEAAAKYYFSAAQSRVPLPLYQVEQGGNVSSSVPPLSVNTWKGGDSGSANMLPLPGELVFLSGRSTTGPTPEMQADMDELSRRAGLDPAKYQMRWINLETLTGQK